MARLWTLVLAFAVTLLVRPPTWCNAARILRDGGPSETQRLFEEKQEFEKRASTWSDRESGGDGVATSASCSPVADDYSSRYKSWVRLQEDLVTEDYGDTPAAANPSAPASPSVPCC